MRGENGTRKEMMVLKVLCTNDDRASCHNVARTVYDAVEPVRPGSVVMPSKAEVRP
jgi:hypothetical protein